MPEVSEFRRVLVQIALVRETEEVGHQSHHREPFLDREHLEPLKSPVCIALIDTISHRIPASASTNQGPAHGHLIRFKVEEVGHRTHHREPLLDREDLYRAVQFSI